MDREEAKSWTRMRNAEATIQYLQRQWRRETINRMALCHAINVAERERQIHARRVLGRM